MAFNLATDAITQISCTEFNDLCQAALKIYVSVPYNF